jgi:predicted XRE-type DNA-binding protein
MKIEHFESVWDAIEPSQAEAENMKARSLLMMSIDRLVKEWGLSQSLAAKRLGLTQPRLNDLLRGRINKFSLDALMTIASKAGLTVKLQVKKRVA